MSLLLWSKYLDWVQVSALRSATKEIKLNTCALSLLDRTGLFILYVYWCADYYLQLMKADDSGQKSICSYGLLKARSGV